MPTLYNFTWAEKKEMEETNETEKTKKTEKTGDNNQLLLIYAAVATGTPSAATRNRPSAASTSAVPNRVVQRRLDRHTPSAATRSQPSAASTCTENAASTTPSGATRSRPCAAWAYVASAVLERRTERRLHCHG